MSETTENPVFEIPHCDNLYTQKMSVGDLVEVHNPYDDKDAFPSVAYGEVESIESVGGQKDNEKQFTIVVRTNEERFTVRVGSGIKRTLYVMDNEKIISELNILYQWQEMKTRFPNHGMGHRGGC